MFPKIDPDFLEILLSETYELVCVLCGRLAEALRYDNFDSDRWFRTSDIVSNASLRALDPDILFKFTPKLFRDVEFKLFDINILYDEKLRKEWERKGIDMDEVKYGYDDRRFIEYYSTLFQRLYDQTNKFSFKELGERIVIAPKNLPKDFSGIEEMVSGVSEPDPLIIELLKEKAEIDIFQLTPKEFFELEDAEKLANDEKLLELKKKINHYEKFYNRYIKVDFDHRRLYTRGRYVTNMLIDLQQHIKQNVVDRNVEKLSLDQFNIFLGFCLKFSLEKYNHIRFDIDEYPIFSRLFTHGSLVKLTFPGIYSEVAEFCNTCDVIHFSLHLYESKTGDVYVIVILEDTDYINLLNYCDQIMVFYDFLRLLNLGGEVPNGHNELFEPFDIVKYGRTHRGINVDPNINVSLGNSISEDYYRRPILTSSDTREIKSIEAKLANRHAEKLKRLLDQIEGREPFLTDEETLIYLNFIRSNLSLPQMTMNIAQQFDDLCTPDRENIILKLYNNLLFPDRNDISKKIFKDYINERP